MANYIVNDKVFIPPYEGRGVRVKKGQFLKIVDVEGKQVGDFICFNENDLSEYVSTVHMRSSLSSIRLKIGDFLYSNYRDHLMQFTEDTVGKHDFFFPACDYYRYKVDFGVEDHPNCKDNLIGALKSFGIIRNEIPDPINWFMNNHMDENGDYVIEDPLSKAGDYVVLKALKDVVCCVSACSQDFVPVNGMKVTPLELQVCELEE